LAFVEALGATIGVGLEVAAAGVVINEFDQLTNKRTDGTKRKSSKRREKKGQTRRRIESSIPSIGDLGGDIISSPGELEW